MRKSIIMIVGLMLCSAVTWAAPDRAGKIDVGVNLSAGFMEDANTAVYIGGNMSYGINSTMAIGFSGGWQEFESDLVGVGELQAVPLFADFYLRAQTDKPFVPYAVMGFGAIIWDFEEGSLLAGSTVDVDTSFGTKIGGGVDWFINDQWAINFEGSYVFTDADTTVKDSSGSITETADADYWNIGGGLKRVF